MISFKPTIDASIDNKVHTPGVCFRVHVTAESSVKRMYSDEAADDTLYSKAFVGEAVVIMAE
jgi:hypothetical protein